MTKSYTLITTLEAKSDKASELKNLLSGVIEPSRTESTCLKYHLLQDVKDPTKFILYEIWISEEAHQKQFQKPYIITLAGKIGELLATPYQVIFSGNI